MVYPVILTYFWPSVDISPLIKSRFLGSFDSSLFLSRGNVNILPFHIHPFLYSFVSELSQNIPFIYLFITSTIPLYAEPPLSLTLSFPVSTLLSPLVHSLQLSCSHIKCILTENMQNYVTLKLPPKSSLLF